MDLIFTPCHYDRLYEVMKWLRYFDLINLIRINKSINHFCKDNRLVRFLFIEKETDHYIREEHRDKTPVFCRAVINNNIEVVKELLKRGFDPSVDNNYTIQYASLKGYHEIVKLLLQDSKLDPSVDGNYPIRASSQNGHYEVVKLLLRDPRVDPTVNGNSAIQSASKNGHLEVVKLLLQDPRVDPSDRDNITIVWTSYYGHYEVVKLLLQDPRVASSNIRLAIKMAKDNNHFEIVDLLRSFKNDV